jgi:predicted alpha/beta hydrolase family esterase
MRNESIRYLIVPGWQGSPDNHWQSHWQRTLPNSARVEQHDWLTPQRQDWCRRWSRRLPPSARR